MENLSFKIKIIHNITKLYTKWKFEIVFRTEGTHRYEHTNYNIIQGCFFEQKTQ